MILVRQLDNTGCGIACVASISHITYLEAKKLIDFGRRRKSYTKIHDLRSALKQLNFKLTKINHTKRWSKIRQNAIVGIDKSGRHWHWVVYDAEKNIVYDPAVGERCDFYNMKPFKYAYFYKNK